MCRSIDRNDIDPGGQATYHDGHKIAFSLWPKLIITVECGILTIKKNYVKTLQIGLHSVILNVSIKNTYNKKKKIFDCKRKITFFYLNFSSIATLKKQNYFLSTLFLEIICILVNVKYFWFLLFANTRHNHELVRVKN